MANQYSHLLSPFRVGKAVFKNRILGGPLGNVRGNPNGIMAPANIAFYSALARGGAARVVGGGDCAVGEPGGGMGLDLCAAGMAAMDVRNAVREYAYNLHRYDCLAFVQLTHAGGSMGPPAGEAAPGAMDAPPAGMDGPPGGGPIPGGMPGAGNPVDTLTPAELDRIAADFALAAKNARDWGLDGVLIHAGHCKLLDMFRAGDYNHRTDAYGGSLENKCRFPIQVLQAIRDAVGPDFIVEYRTSVDECVPGGVTIDETIEFMKLIDQKGLIDLLHCTSGRHTEPLLNAYCISPATFPRAPHRKFCRALKDAGIQTPLVIINSCADPDVAEDILASGDADLICMSRQINLADPYYPRKLREGRPELIDNCLRCHGCFDVVGPCYVNPLAPFETASSTYRLEKSPDPKKVIVVGGGIAGLKAAYTAAERGNQVVLFEREQALGGQLRFADTDTYKLDIRRYKQSMVQRVTEHPNVTLRLGVEATPELIAAQLPASLIVAIGGAPKRPDIPGVDGQNVLTVMESYLHPEKLGRHVLLLGSGLTACETALHLARVGKTVTIVGRRDKLMYHETAFQDRPTSMYSPEETFLQWYREQGTALYLGWACTAITPDGVTVENVKTGQTRSLAADTVLLAAGMTDRRAEALRFGNLGAGFFAMAGDCREPKKIREAVAAGYFAGMEA